MVSTVQALYPRVRTLCPPRSLATYDIGFRRLTEAFGPLPCEQVTVQDLLRLREQVRQEVGQAKVASAVVSGRALRSYDERAHGHGAAENFVRAARLFFRIAVEDGHLAASPAAKLPVPARPPAPERPLTSNELADLWRVAATTGDDPELDCLILELLRHTAARRGGLIALRLQSLDVSRLSITLSEKQGRVRELPLGRGLLLRIREHALRRGAAHPSDAALRYRDGSPLTRRRFNSLFDRVDRHTAWSEALDVGAHWIRHTTLADIAAVAGIRVAEAFAGHSDHAMGTIGRYTKVPFDDLIAAYEELFGPRD